MTLTLNPDIEVQLRTIAEERGVAPEHLHEDLLRVALAEARLQQQVGLVERRTRIAKFQQWAEANGHNTPLLSDQAISRSTIYGER